MSVYPEQYPRSSIQVNCIVCFLYNIRIRIDLDIQQPDTHHRPHTATGLQSKRRGGGESTRKQNATLEWKNATLE